MPMKYSVKVRPGIWSEVRFRKLEAILGCRYKAAGRLIEFWQEAASYWVDGRLIPKDIFKMMDAQFLIESGFAEEVDGGIRAKGDEDHFSWLKSQREKGVKSAEVRKAKFGSAQPNKSRTEVEPKSNHGSATTRTESNPELRTKNLELEKNTSLTGSEKSCDFSADDANAQKNFLNPDSEIPETHDEIPVDFSGEKSMPVSPTETHPESTQEPSPVSRGQSDQKSTDSNDSGIKIETHDSNKIKPIKKPRKRPDVTPEESAARSATRAAYIDSFVERYSEKPVMAAAQNTMIANIVKSVGQQDAPFIVKFYLECSDEWLVNNFHPLTALVKNTTEYMVRWKRGQTYKQRQPTFAPAKRRQTITDDDIKKIVEACS